jgi:hypothetical protein
VIPGEKGPIPLDIARQLCTDIRKEKAPKLFSQCWGCMKATKGAEEKMCFHRPPDFRGCGLVNDMFDNGR